MNKVATSQNRAADSICRRYLKMVAIAALVPFLNTVATLDAHADLIYTSESSFTAAIAPGYYLEDFHAYDALPLGGAYQGSAVNFGPVAGYSYTASAPNGIFGIQQGTGDGALSTNNPNESLTLTFTGNSVTAIGGIFFPTDNAGRPANGTVTVTLSDGSTSTIINDPSAFRGFTTDAPITSLQVFTLGGTVWPSLDHLYVGASAVPEPASIVLSSFMAIVVAIAGRSRLTKHFNRTP